LPHFPHFIRTKVRKVRQLTGARLVVKFRGFLCAMSEKYIHTHARERASHRASIEVSNTEEVEA
jgi:hypothetical protein